ncbi:hypothetical protein TgHK011_006699 [Trichoderma gracile]|nr:hypothetical protein TgHK011_006699 [Trichoderma gracile]
MQPASAWRHFLQALAYCQEFDVVVQGAREAQAPTTTPKPSPEEVNLYWACWRAEMDLRLCLGPFDFQEQDRAYIQFLPDVSVNPYVDIKVRLFYSAEIALLKLTTRARNDIGQILSSSEGNDEDRVARLLKAVESYDKQGKEWLASLPKAISNLTKTSDLDTHKFTLGCRFRDFRELIFWVFIEAAINSGKERLPDYVYTYARQGILACMNRIRLAVEGQNHRHERTWVLLQSCARSVVILVAASLSHHAQTLLHKDWASTADAGIHVLRQWMGESDGIRNQVRALEDLRELEELLKKLGS